MEEVVEIWKSLDFLGYPDYETSNFGRVKSLKFGKEKILKQSKNKGYLVITLSKNNKQKHFKVHQLVCLTFLENPNNLPYVNHKDENKQNNHVSNLCWCSHIENINYGTRNERVSKSNKGKPKSEEHKQKIRKSKYKQRKPILQFTKEGTFIREWDSATTVNKELNLSQGNITACCKGKRKTCGDFIWRYKENNTNLVIS